MRRVILTDDSGRILASGPATEDLVSAGLHFGYRPLRGQQIHTVELPAHINSLKALQDLHRTHRVEKAEGISRLIQS